MSDTLNKVPSDQKRCPACAELILIAAKKCKHCGEVTDQPASMKADAPGVNRKIGFSLGLGILFIPHLFAWFTLREGYNRTSRLTAFSWLLILVLFQLNLRGGDGENRSRNPTAVPETAEKVESNPMGNWSIGRYVDQFGDPTKSGFLTNIEPISGSFSNSATTNSRLDVKFLVDSNKSMSIVLYEYSGKNPVKAYGNTIYRILAKDKDGIKSSLDGNNYKSDRISVDVASSKKLHKMFQKGGSVNLVVFEVANQINTYTFTVDATGYQNAYNKLYPEGK